MKKLFEDRVDCVSRSDWTKTVPVRRTNCDLAQGELVSSGSSSGVYDIQPLTLPLSSFKTLSKNMPF